MARTLADVLTQVETQFDKAASMFAVAQRQVTGAAFHPTFALAVDAARRAGRTHTLWRLPIEFSATVQMRAVRVVSRIPRPTT